MNRPNAETASRVDMPLIGMHCAACAVRIEGALNTAPGVSRAAVNFATGRATVEYNSAATSPNDLITMLPTRSFTIQMTFGYAPKFN